MRLFAIGIILGICCSQNTAAHLTRFSRKLAKDWSATTPPARATTKSSRDVRLCLVSRPLRSNFVNKVWEPTSE